MPVHAIAPVIRHSLAPGQHITLVFQKTFASSKGAQCEHPFAMNRRPTDNDSTHIFSKSK